jgi:hypothetical protein
MKKVKLRNKVIGAVIALVVAAGAAWLKGCG